MAISIIQTSTPILGASTNLATYIPLTNPVTGNLLVVSASYFLSGGAFTVTDDTGANTWIKAKESPAIGSGLSLTSIWYCLNAASGPMTVQLNMAAGGGYVSAGFLEASGIAAVPLDKTDDASGVTGVLDVWPATLGDLDTGTLSQADELVITALGSTTGGITAVNSFIPSGFSSLFSNPSGAVYQWGEGRYKIVAVTTNVQPQWTMGGSLNMTGCIATFKQAGAAAAGRHQYGMVA